MYTQRKVTLWDYILWYNQNAGIHAAFHQNLEFPRFALFRISAYALFRKPVILRGSGLPFLISS